MQGKIKKLSGHYIVCGYGNLSDTICLKLHELDIPFVIVEPDDARREMAQQRASVMLPRYRMGAYLYSLAGYVLGGFATS